jgi:hypothetical protein
MTPRVLLLAASLVVTVACAGGDDDSADATAQRQAEVAERGREVMPFDLELTTHRFEPQDDGLMQTVVADPPVDPQQVDRIREHLREEAERFSEGDFSDPAAIHGHDMPGLVALADRADEIDVSYTEVVDGARITYRTQVPELVDALHDWSDAQLMDHGAHAEGGHGP